MNVVIEDESKKNKKLKILYIGIISICLIAIISAVVLQIVKENNGSEVANLPQLTDDQKNKHKEEFYNIFENKVNYLENNSYKITKLESNKEIILFGLDFFRGYLFCNVHTYTVSEFQKNKLTQWENEKSLPLNKS